MSRLVPSEATRLRQHAAADPRGSVFVSANAGSGKTHVLVERVIRLLLSGIEPDRILCLTFTRAAAAQMQAKVAQRLAEWSTMDEPALRTALAASGSEPDGGPSLARARRLFAEALETPGGLKIQTIHAFCERLLQQFPFEANVPAGFDVLDEREAAAMREAAKRQVYVAIGRGGAAAAAMTAISAENLETRLDEAFDGALALRGSFRKLAECDGLDTVAKRTRALAAALGIAPDTSPETARGEILARGFLAGGWTEVADWLGTGGKSDCDLAAKLRAAAAASDAGERLALYLSVFLTGELEPRGQGFATKKLRTGRPDLAARLDDEQARVAALLEQSRAASALRRTGALHALAEPLLAAYAEEKARRGALDFDDLIAKTLRLLSRTDAAWVLFKLDGGIDHLLIDEAQDTNPDAWAIVETLVAEFTAGRGAREQVRTVFAVGDEKQSIYRFQGAAPEEFARVGRALERKHRDALLEFGTVRLTESFRSTSAVLRGVDHVFARPQSFTGLESIEPRPTAHTTARHGAPGLVEVWPLVEAPPEPRRDREWDAPFDRPVGSSPVALLADRIAVAVRDWIGGGMPPGEILILVRQRLALFEAILRALKAERLPVAGADRLVINDHIAVLDLLALGDALVTPDDDLSLASALKSPLFGLDDADLIALAPRRSGRLRDALTEGAATVAQVEAVKRLRRWEARARTASPYEFYAAVLGRDGMRRAFRSRFDTEADDALDAFLSAAETFAKGHPPTLAGFLLWMRAARTEIKRDLDIGGGEVRVMTVHGAKGLEAGLVLLAESCSPPCGRIPMLPLLAVPDAIPGSPPLPVWITRKADDCAALKAARADHRMHEQHEHRRLLYVALTRAEDRLVVTGHKGRNRRDVPEGCWYDHVRAGLREHAEAVPVAWSAEPILRLTDGVFAPFAAPSAPAEAPALPAWLREDAPREPPPEPVLAPSLIGGGAVRRHRAGARSSPGTRARGLLLHRLLERLPALPPERRAAAAAALAARQLDLAPDMRRACADAALAILDDPRFAAVFTPQARVEVPLRGRLRRADGSPGPLVSGRLDRLLVTERDVLVVDYKTDAEPAVEGGAPAGYLAQLAAYRSLLTRLHRGRPVRCAILWTAAPRLDIVAGDVLDRMEAEICAAAAADTRFEAERQATA